MRHIRAEEEKDIERISESKYVQSQMGDCLLLAKNDLKFGRKVLFSGTACQIAGLRSYLGKKYDNLICIDVICHGVPSPKVWKRYVCMLQQERKVKIRHISHRGKHEGGWHWQKQFFETVYESGDIWQENIWENSYTRGFLKDLYLNRACHECAFKNERIMRVSDLTMADYWGCEKEEPGFFDANGVNLVLVNTEKGANTLKQYEKLFFLKKTNLERALMYNVAAIKPYRKPFVRKRFFRYFKGIRTLNEFNRLITRCEKFLVVENFFVHAVGRLKHWIIVLIKNSGITKKIFNQE